MLTDKPYIKLSMFGNPYDLGQNHSYPQKQYKIFEIESKSILNTFFSHNRGNLYFDNFVSGSFMIKWQTWTHMITDQLYI